MIPVFSYGEVADLQRQADGSFTKQVFQWTSGRPLGLGPRTDALARFDQSFGNCAGTARTFKLPPAWQPMGDQAGVSSRNPVGGNLLGDGTLVGVGSYTSNGNRAYVVIANPDGSLRSTSTLNVANNAVSYLIADFNGDKKLDLAVMKFGDGGSDAGGVAIYKGNGDGTFGSPTTFAAGKGAESATAFDFNKDGILDLAVGSYFSNDIAVLIGKGDGIFKAPVSYSAGNQVFSVAAGDLNSDGIGDLIASSINSNTPVPTGKVVLLLGKGDGTFQPAQTILSNVVPTGLATGDFNHDGKTDLVVTESTNNTVILMLGDGRGGFSTSTTYQASSGSPLVTDIDGDGNLDVVIAAGHPDSLTASASINDNAEELITILFGKGDGTLLGAPTWAAGQVPSGIAAGDFNGDSKLDLAVTSSGSKDLWIFLGKGPGLFQAPTRLTITGAKPSAIVAAKFNGDANSDLAVADSASNKVHLMLAKGDGTFFPAVSYGVGGSPNSLVAVDLNGDGNIDLAVASPAAPAGVNILLNDGSGVFQPGKTVTAGAAPTTLASGDFNKDGFMDLVAADPGTGIQLLLGTGDGAFQPAVAYPAGGNPALVAAGDLNGDGFLDVIAAGPAGSGDAFMAVLLGAGDGTFSDPQATPLGFRPAAIGLADLNGDSKLDMAVAECCGEAQVAYLLGNGDGTFQAETGLRGGTSHLALLAADLNGDGKADLVIGDGGPSNSTGYVTVLLNATAAVPNPATNANAASLLVGPVAPDSLVTATGTGLASGSAADGLDASEVPYPTDLGGTTVKVKDSAGVELLAQISSVSAKRVKYILPAGTAIGAATVTITAADGTVSLGPVMVEAAAPGLFVREGTDLPVATVIRTQGDVTSNGEVATVVDGAVVAAPIDLGPETDVVTLVLTGTGIRGRSSLDQVTVGIGGVTVSVDAADPVADYPGLDRIGFVLPRSLMGLGDVSISVTIDGQAANVVRVNIL